MPLITLVLFQISPRMAASYEGGASYPFWSNLVATDAADAADAAAASAAAASSAADIVANSAGGAEGEMVSV